MADQFPVGIDLGTTFSAVAYLDVDGRPATLPNAEGALITPSAVFFDSTGAIVGQEALAAGQYEPERLAQFAKRDMGEMAFSKTIRHQRLPAEVIQAIILKKLKEDAELKLKSVSDVVITVPAYFNEPCRRATQDAGRLAGLNVLDIINEPTAAAFCYGVQKGFLTKEGASKDRERVLIYDLGGGTFDVTIMEIDGTDYKAVATSGDVYLGGIDWDGRLMDHIAEAFIDAHGIDPREDAVGRQALLLKAAEVKHSLTSRAHVSTFFNYAGKRLKHEVDRKTFEDLTSDLLDRTMMTVRTAVREARLTFSQLTRLLLVGGSTRMPAVRSLLERETGLTADRSLSPDEAVAHGAAIYAGLLMRTGGDRIKGMSVVDVNSHDLGVLGVERATGRPRRSIMIPRNSPLPMRVSKLFPTARDGQKRVDINVIEGGDDSGNHSTRIGRCSVKGLPPDLPAKTHVKVTFEYEQNGRLRVSAKLPSVGIDADMEIQRATGLDQETLENWTQLVQSGFPDDMTSVLTVDADVCLSDDEQVTPPAPMDRQPSPAVRKAGTPDVVTQVAANQPGGGNQSASASGSATRPVKKLGSPVRKLGQPVRKLGRPIKKSTQPAKPASEGVVRQDTAETGQRPEDIVVQEDQEIAVPQPAAKKKTKKKTARKGDWRSQARKLSDD